MRTFVINLDKDVEKWKQMRENFKHTDLHLERFSAIVGKDYRNSPNVSDMCRELCTDGMIGCAASHLAVMQKIVDDQIPIAIVLEDDVSPVENFNTTIHTIIRYHLPKQFDLLMIGNSLNMNESLSGPSSPHDLFKDKYVKFKDKFIMNPQNVGGTQGYIVSQQGAQNILKHVKRISYHIDWVLLSCDDLIVYETRNILVSHDGMQTGMSLGESHHPVWSIFTPKPSQKLKHRTLSAIDGAVWVANEPIFCVRGFTLKVYHPILTMLILYILYGITGNKIFIIILAVCATTVYATAEILRRLAFM